MESNLKRLRELTDKLPNLHEFVGYNQDGVVSYNVSGGKGVGRCLYAIPDIAVQRVHYTKGMSFHAHTHEEIEMGIVYKGALKTKSDRQGEVTTHPGEVIVFSPGEMHSHWVEEETDLIAITIPASKDYPHA